MKNPIGGFKQDDYLRRGVKATFDCTISTEGSFQKAGKLSGQKSLFTPSVPASFFSAVLTVVHAADSITADDDPTLFTFKLSDLMGLNQGVE